MLRGDFEEALIHYTACIMESSQEPVYFLNRSAVCLKLKWYVIITKIGSPIGILTAQMERNI